MHIRRAPLGQGNLTFKKRRQRYPLVLIVLYVLVLFAALYVFWNVDRFQSGFSAFFWPPPTPTSYPEDLVRQADEAYQAGDLKQAIELYRQASEIDPQNVQLLSNLSRMLTLGTFNAPAELKAAQLQEALVVAERAILAAPEDPRGYAVKARALDWAGEYDSAVVAALRAVELDADYAPARAYLAEAYTDIGQLRLAREQAEMAIQLDPYDVDARTNYAYVLNFYGDYSGAIQQYIQALNLQPNMLDLMYGLAWNYRGARQYEQSITTFREIMVRTPDDPKIYIELGKTYYQMRDDDSAQSIYEQAVRLICDDCPRHGYAEILATQEPRSTEEFTQFLERTDRNLPGEVDLSAWVGLGQVYYARRNYESALEILEEAIAYGDTNKEEVQIEAYYVTAGAYYYLDRCEIAIPRAKLAFDLYVERKIEDNGTLSAILSWFVLCRDHATNNPYMLTAPGFTNGFPDGYEEPDVIVERGNSSISRP